jgi:hypothetical protein
MLPAVITNCRRDITPVDIGTFLKSLTWEYVLLILITVHTAMGWMRGVCSIRIDPPFFSVILLGPPPPPPTSTESFCKRLEDFSHHKPYFIPRASIVDHFHGISASPHGLWILLIQNVLSSLVRNPITKSPHTGTLRRGKKICKENQTFCCRRNWLHNPPWIKVRQRVYLPLIHKD